MVRRTAKGTLGTVVANPRAQSQDAHNSARPQRAKGRKGAFIQEDQNPPCSTSDSATLRGSFREIYTKPRSHDIEGKSPRNPVKVPAVSKGNRIRNPVKVPAAADARMVAHPRSAGCLKGAAECRRQKGAAECRRQQGPVECRRQTAANKFGRW